MTEWLLTEIARVRTVVEAAVVLFAVFATVQVWMRTRQFAPTLGAALFSAVVIWAVRNTDVLERLIGQEFR